MAGDTGCRAPAGHHPGRCSAILQGFTAPPAEDAAASGSPSPDDVATAIQGVVQEAQEALFKVLEQVTLADLCNRVRQQHEKTAAGFVYVI